MLAIAVVFLAAIAVEASFSRRMVRPPYQWDEVETTLGLLMGWTAAAVLASFLLRGVNGLAFDIRLADLTDWALSPLLLIVTGDFLYYWAHRSSHAVRWLWASHVVHHSSTRLSFLASLRQGWTDLVSGTWLFWLPLGIAGFAPASWGIYFAALMGWQLWIHNEWLGRLGALEYVVVTPSHHRVHHSLRPEHFNCNFGGIFIVWDRLFGTFVDEGTVKLTDFGLHGRGVSTNLVAVAFGEWRNLFADLRASPSLKHALRQLLVLDAGKLVHPTR